MHEIVVALLPLADRIEPNDLMLFDRCLFPFLPWNNLEKSLTSSQPHHIPSLRHLPLLRINFDYRFNFVVCLFSLIYCWFPRFSLTKLIQCAIRLTSDESCRGRRTSGRTTCSNWRCCCSTSSTPVSALCVHTWFQSDAVNSGQIPLIISVSPFPAADAMR